MKPTLVTTRIFQGYFRETGLRCISDTEIYKTVSLGRCQYPVSVCKTCRWVPAGNISWIMFSPAAQFPHTDPCRIVFNPCCVS